MTSFDLETTGFTKNDSIISISLIRFTSTTVHGIFSTLINPEKMIPDHIVDLTGINNEMVRGFPILDDKLINEIIQFIKGQNLYAYNAPFESRFMEKIYFRDVKVIDVMNPLRVHWKFDKNKKLKEAAQHFRLETRMIHDSLNDALICFNLINILNRNGYRWV